MLVQQHIMDICFAKSDEHSNAGKASLTVLGKLQF